MMKSTLAIAAVVTLSLSTLAFGAVHLKHSAKSVSPAAATTTKSTKVKALTTPPTATSHKVTKATAKTPAKKLSTKKHKTTALAAKKTK